MTNYTKNNTVSKENVIINYDNNSLEQRKVTTNLLIS